MLNPKPSHAPAGGQGSSHPPEEQGQRRDRQLEVAGEQSQAKQPALKEIEELAASFLRLINESLGIKDLIRRATAFFHDQSGCEAVGIRLKQGDDYPYHETRGFPQEFVLAENSLCTREPGGQIQRDSVGNPVLACMCGNIICGRFDPSKPFFSPAGSFWTNNTTQLLATTTEADRQARTRNRCNGQGYESVALIPLRSGQATLGLLQLNDKQPGRFTPELIAFWERLAGYLAVAIAKAQAEEALRVKETDLTEAQRVGHIGSWHWDGKTDVTSGSDELLRIYGLDPAKQTMPDFKDQRGRCYTVEDWERINAAVQRTLETGVGYELDVRVFRNRTTIWVTTRGEAVRDAQGQIAGLRGTVQDITERKLAEEVLREGESAQRRQRGFLECVIANAGSCIAVVKGHDLRYTMANSAFQAFVPDGPMVGRTYREVFPEAAEAGAEARIQRVLETGEPWQVEDYRAPVPGKPDATWQGQVVRLPAAPGEEPSALAVVWDITERKRAAEALRESQAKLKAAFANMTEAIFIADAEGRLIDFNEGFVRYHRFKDREECSRTIADCPRYLEAYFQDGTPAPPDMWAMARALRGETASNVEYMLRRKETGETWWGSYNFAPIKDEGGRIVGAVVAGREITERKRAEEERNQLMEHRQMALDAARMVAWEYDPVTGKVTLSDEAEQTLALPGGKRLEDSDQGYQLIHPDDVEHHRALVTEAIATGGHYVSVYRHAHGGEVVWLEERGQAVVDQTGRTIRLVGIVQNISERKQAEAALAESEARLRRLMERVPIPLGVVNKNGEIVFVNDRFVQVFGYTRADVPTVEAWWQQAYPDAQYRRLVRENWEAKILRATETHTLTEPEEFHVACKDGAVRVVVISNIIIEDNILASFTDITERKQAEEAARRNEEQLRALADSILNLAWWANGDGYITWYNRRWYEYTGTTPEQMEGWGWQSVHDPQALPEVMAQWQASIATGEPFEMTFPLRGADGTFRRFLTRIQPLKDAQGRVVRWFGTNTDVEELKRTEEALREAEQRLRFSLESCQIGAWDMDLESQTAFRSLEHDRIFGYREQLPSWTLDDFLKHALPEYRAPVEKMVREATAAKTGWTYECQIRRADGEVRWIWFSGQHRTDSSGHGHVAGVVQDITERKQTEEHMRELTQRLTYHVDHSPLAVIEWGPDMRLVRWSGEAERLFGWKAEEVLGKRMEDFRWIYQEDEPQVAEVSGDLQSGVNPRRFWANRNYCKDGSVVHCEWYNSSLVDASGKLLSILSLVLDVTKRKQAEKERDRVFEYSLDMLCVAGFDGYFKRVSPSFEKTLGWSEAELLSRPFFDFMHPDDRDETLQAIKAHERGKETIQLENRYRCKDGSYKWIAWNAHAVVEEQLVVAVARDITERKQAEDALHKRAEEALRMSEQEFRSLAEAMPQIVWATRPDGWNIYFNQQWVDYTGMTMEESYGHGWNTPFHPDDKQRAWEAWQCATQHNERYSLECRLRRRDGVYRWWLIRGEPMRGANGEILKWFGTCTDIEEIKQAGAALRQAHDTLDQRVKERTEQLQQSEALLRGITDTSPDAIFLKDHASRVLLANPATLAALNKRAEAVLGKTDEEFYDDPAMGRLMMANDRRVMESGRTEVVEEIIPSPSGPRTFLSAKTPYRDAEGHVIGIIGIARDITDRKRAEEHLEASLREKEVMLKEIHHRVKNNLQVISSLVELQTNSLADPVLRGLFQDVRNRVRSMALVHEKLYQSDNLASVDFADYTRSLIGFLSRAHAGSETTVRFKLDLKPVSLPVERAVPCGLILNELITNAFKHGFRGRAEGEVTTSLSTGPDRRVRLRVSDNGVGLPAGLDWRKSSSLGLQLIHLLSGQLDATVEVRTGAGTEFLISFEQPQRG